ncbi:MAG: NAD(P)/FAD-dependent oxidoreductase [Gammaproteobacteria bacterium]|nr:NAD(P)/FAD-dependent oxidoreductase [Gammaproteobacteria bacterium]MDH5302855.1 NAD(P)/FAD-dependent oxidoreductase [Gammaproteobacteria bacterium]MDH5322713.1 NAD(P)/FAD-dependent oxidoreductase [Gammaproteobacteria bacterium]
MRNFDVIVLGGGAAGLMCAFAAGQRGRRVIVLESSNKIGKKILMSGGGRCNFTNLHCDPSRFISANPHFCISALQRYTQWDFVALVEKHNIAYYEKTAGQLFCERSSRDILGMLEAECDSAGVQILTHCEVQAVRQPDDFEVASNMGEFSAAALVIATGGLSIPKMGASDFGYRLARQFGLNVLDTRPGLVPFTFTGAIHEITERLSGVSLPATVQAGQQTFAEDILFTHRGLSGPAALQASSYWTPGEDIVIDLLPTTDAAALLLHAKTNSRKTLLRSVLSEHLPKALVTELQNLCWPTTADKPIGDWPDAGLRQLAATLNGWTVRPAGTEGYRTAEVTLGGIDTNELSSKTMQCIRRPGLYCIGEVVDVTGHLGGFNFQWAWSSAQAAANAI